MIQEPSTLYKLMTLYMLNQVNFPLTNSQLSEFFLDKEYTNYFSLQQVLNDLIESHFISSHVSGNSTRYDITDDGQETLGFFESDIPSAAKADMDLYIKTNKFRLRSEVGNTAEYYKAGNKNYIVHCEVREGRSILFSMDISVPDEKDAERMCNNWREKCQQIYGNTIKTLIGGSK